MPFTPTINTNDFVPSPAPLLPGSERVHYERELRRISTSINALSAAVKEIQDYLKTLP